MLERATPTEFATTLPALTGRRVLFFTLVGLTIAGMLALLIVALSPGGFGMVDLVLVILFAMTLPWYVIGFWNSAIGVLILRFARDPVAAVTPVAGRITGSEPITASTAIVLCVRNEPPERAAALLTPLMQGLAARGAAAHFHAFILSDTDDLSIAAAETERYGAQADEWRGRLAITYRRRAANTGFKAGNIRDFCERWGNDHDFMIVLDADSVMTTDTVVRLVRIMQIDPRIGILQSLVTGLPSTSAFARIFQFGMRLGMRSYTTGSAWWQGDCGPYWGHNAIIRLAPFMAHCHLPILPEVAHIKDQVLSHDQIEAVLMRRAGYEVRVLTEEGSSFEQNPPTLIEFMRRDLRWCQGNMQYWHFLRLPGLKAVSRYQLVFAILMFLGSPAWIALLLLSTAAVALARSPAEVIVAGPGYALLLLILAAWFAPQYATAIDVLARPQLRRVFGGSARFVAGVAINTVFIILLVPNLWLSHTLLFGRLLLGGSVGWGAQARDDHEVPWSYAARQLWPQTVLGLVTIGTLGATVPSAIPYALLIAGGLLLSIPLAVVTASPAVGRALVHIGLCRLPEETAPPPELSSLKLSAIEMARGSGE